MKQVILIAYTLEKRFVVTVTFECSGIVFFSESTKNSLNYGLCKSSLYLQRRDSHINIVYKMLGLMCPRVYLFRKTAVENPGYGFAYFCGGYKNDFRLQIF